MDAAEAFAVATCWERGGAGPGSTTLGSKELARCLQAVLTSGSDDPGTVVASLWEQIQSMQTNPALAALRMSHAPGARAAGPGGAGAGAEPQRNISAAMLQEIQRDVECALCCKDRPPQICLRPGRLAAFHVGACRPCRFENPLPPSPSFLSPPLTLFLLSPLVVCEYVYAEGRGGDTCHLFTQ